MKLELSNKINHFLVLGAGASVDYGLPVWKKLNLLMLEKIKKDIEKYKFKKEMIAWIDKVGEGKEYDTIDKCIKEESVSREYSSDGAEIENRIFLVLKDILDESYKDNDDGWIKILNQKILHNEMPYLEQKISFINFNYDNVLEKNFLNFDELTSKEKRHIHRVKLEALSQINVEALYPHGCFPLEPELKVTSQVARYIDTIKSHDKEHLDTVSCHEGRTHTVTKIGYEAQIKPIKLYLLGLGGGLKINMDKISFSSPVSELYVTIKDPSIKDNIINFLSEKYNIPATEIKVYSTCDELVKNCFSS